MERLTAIEKIGIIGGRVKLVFKKEKKGPFAIIG